MRQHLAALRLLLVMTVVLGVLYPAAVTLAAQLPGLKHKADGSLVRTGGAVVGSSLIGQSFAGHDEYFQSRPSAAGDGYDPTASGAGNLGPESVVDTDDRTSLLTTVCARSLAVGTLEHVDGSRPFCTGDGTGSVLAVFWSGPGYAGHPIRVVSADQACPAVPFLLTYEGVAVTCRDKGADLSRAEIVPVRGDAPAHPAVPADAVTASGSGLDPHISPAYARIQEARVAQARGLTVAAVDRQVREHTDGRSLGFVGEARVNVLELNLDLDRATLHR